MTKINFRSDFTLVMHFTIAGEPVAIPDGDFALAFRTSERGVTYVCSRKGNKLINCAINDGVLTCIFDNHNLQPGTLKCTLYDLIPDALFPDGERRVVTPSVTDVELVVGSADGDEATAEIVADLEQLRADMIAATDDCVAATEAANTAADAANDAIDEIEEIIEHLPSGGLSGIVDLSDVFATGVVADINAAIVQAQSDGKVVYVGMGDYIIDGTLSIVDIDAFVCMGNLIGAAHSLTSTPESHSAMRALVVYASTGGKHRRCYIRKLTVRHNYSAFHAAYATLARIEIGEIVGQYDNVITLRAPKSVFNGGAKDASVITRYMPLTDAWTLNAGITADHLQASHLIVGSIHNLNYGFYSICSRTEQTYGDGWVDEGIYENTIDITTIVCKKAVVFDMEHLIELNNGVPTKRAITGDDSPLVGDRDVHGNVFNLYAFDVASAPNTNSVEICNTDFYNTQIDNRRVVFSIRATSLTDRRGLLLANNTFNVNYAQGVYDVFIDAKNAASCTWNVYLQVNDLYLNDATANAMRFFSVSKANTWEKGLTGGGFAAAVDVMSGAVVIFDGCFQMRLNNYQRAFLRPSEVSVTNSRDVYINQVNKTDYNAEWYHQINITNDNYKNVQARLYDVSGTRVRAWGEDFPLFDSEIIDAINTICI